MVLEIKHARKYSDCGHKTLDTGSFTRSALGALHGLCEIDALPK